MKLYGVKLRTWWDMKTKAPKKNARRIAKQEIVNELSNVDFENQDEARERFDSAIPKLYKIKSRRGKE